MARTRAAKPTSTSAEAAVEDLETQRSRLLATGRSAFGVVGRVEYGPLREALDVSGLRVADAIVVGVLGALSATTVVVWSIFADRMTAALGVSGFYLLPLVELAVAGVVGGAVLGTRVATRARRSSRVRTAAIGGGFAAATFACASLASGSWGIWGLVPAAALGGVSFAAMSVSHIPLLWDMYRPEIRVRMMTLYAAVVLTGTAAAVLLMSIPDGRSGLTWRAVLVLLAGVAAVAAGATALVKEPEAHRWDRGRLDRMVEGSAGGPADHDQPSAETTGAVESGWERSRRVLAVPSTRFLLLAAGAGGLVLAPIPTYLLVLLRDRFDVTHGAWIIGLTMLGNTVGLCWFARRGEVGFRDAPPRLLLTTIGMALVGGVALTLAAVAPDLVATAVCLAVMFSGIAVLLPASAMTLTSVVSPDCRAEASFLAGLSILGGAVAGQQLFSSFAVRFGASWALVVGGASVIAVAVGLVRPMRTAAIDLDAVVGEIVEAAELRVMVAAGRHLPLLRCHNVDFSYGQLQVLFGVDFTVDDGQMVALLGTNGAGKSTLLRAISGIGHNDRGTIHFRGEDITHAGADARVRMGITQVAGGRAVFGPMNVVDNLRTFVYTFGRDEAAVQAGIDVCFAAFPRLAERRAQLAATLSGGEQQMLGLTKAFILRPKLLLIDELSLGLAPVIVSSLLEMVRRINAEGTAVVLVEQSANIALSLVDHAYFMEKGEIRFDGRAADLLARPDLLRSVFLEGASTVVT